MLSGPPGSGKTLVLAGRAKYLAVQHPETLANLSALPAEAAAAVEATLKGHRLVPAGQAVTITRSVPHGHLAAVAAMAATLGLPAMLGPAGRARDLALALIISRVARPASKLSTLTWWAECDPGCRPGRRRCQHR